MLALSELSIPWPGARGTAECRSQLAGDLRISDDRHIQTQCTGVLRRASGGAQLTGGIADQVSQLADVVDSLNEELDSIDSAG